MKEVTFKVALYEAIAEEMKLDNSVVLVGFGVSNIPFIPMPDRKRIIDLPSSGNNAVQAAIGIAMTGAKVILYIRGEYLLRCYESIVCDAALTDYMYASQYASNITIIAETGYLPKRSPQLNNSVESAFAYSTELTVVYPANAYQAKGLLRSAISYEKPVLYLYSGADTDAEGDIPESFNFKLPLQKAYHAKEGDDLTIITYGAAVKLVSRAVEDAGEKDISCDVIDLCTINPYDKDEILKSVKKTGKVLIVHEAHEAFGVGAEIAAFISGSEAFYYLDLPIERLCAKNAPVGYSFEAYDNICISKKDIYNTICRMANKEA